MTTIKKPRRVSFRRRWNLFILLKACLGFCLLAWLLTVYFLSSGSTHPTVKSYLARSHHPHIEYTIPLEFLPKHPVRVAARDYAHERIRTKDGRRSYISTEAFREFGQEVRYLIDTGKDNLKNGANTTTMAWRQRFHQRAPWLKGDFRDPNWPFSAIPTYIPGKAIVICAGDPQLHYLKNLVYAIRVDHASTMPIRIVFLDDNDLTPPSRLQVEGVIPGHMDKNIEFLNLSNYFNLKEVQLKGWDLKAYGLMAVKEQEVVFLDVDVMLLQPPERLFEQQGYKNTGALVSKNSCDCCCH